MCNNRLYREDIVVEALPNRMIEFEIDAKGELCDWRIVSDYRRFRAITCARLPPELVEMLKETKPMMKLGPNHTEQADFDRSRSMSVTAKVVMRFPMAENKEEAIK